uniref:Zinc finger protein 582 n=1 Tax=Cacopsylla melanoneura TaxID=428564 RepID=A0A8D9F1M9_9HEMI
MRVKHSMLLNIPDAYLLLKTKTKLTIKERQLYKCPECPSIQYSFDTLKNHIFKMHNMDEFPCPLCKKIFTVKRQLLRHVRTVHDKIRNYQCPICGHSFADVTNLNVHMHIHTGEKKHVCDVCGKSFTQWAHLYQHKFSHSDELYVCSHCGRNYSSPASLRRHITTCHTNVTEYPCEICGKGFRNKQILKDHLSIHNSARPFSCELCNASFKLRKYLVQHYRTHKKGSKDIFFEKMKI